MTHPPLRLAVIGAGWRSEFLLRLAAAVPDSFQCTAVLARSEAARARLRAHHGVTLVPTLDALLETGPELVIACVSWESMPQVVRELVGRGVRVLAETPPAPDLEGLRSLWSDAGASGLVQVAEQYMLMPGHASRKAVVDRGVIGRPTFVEVASTHMYHAMSIMRTFLGVGMDEAVVHARRLTAPLVNPLSFDGWRRGNAPEPTATTIATLDFGDGRSGLYLFTDNQWWNPLLSRRVLVRGERGEIVDDDVVRLSDEGVISSPLSYRRLGVDMNLEGNELASVSFDGHVVYRNPCPGSRLSEDDLAVASFLRAAGAWARGEGPEPYPLAQACQDHYLALVVEESVRTGREVRTSRQVWAASPVL
ncbi:MULTISPECIES: Gfo/Idh/MocA family oxidoreductase [unclassified Actinomyces]|uniref:Gfo/Idh/MocA family protein n=1 Tax=unclassified Actinomyces TaxID=2609248 RepID=UPI002016EA68|nr:MULTISPECIES: Gfo/Idh/MocA family oxidoreductase [unclassified Actinomyces]MCL3777115.1 Gfo/Idh/MocA family oxidoreductase [Actinomyces sp. AC-20-1]MCL3788969.1 Gfo/Idh/MocA family oxidoreductase [Actinomyces sp. 187325]MCL3791301.1 Gfo/Idh/MocA family oxidoreductase [Actinomyces sp. 186855]MCL3794132.1 Gfo/Idh/MocA family oxidoreductase [Actinomyces sp. 217892]